MINQKLTTKNDQTHNKNASL